MDRDTIIRLAREAGLSHFYDSEGHCTGVTDARLCTEEKERDDDRLAEILAPFAALVAAREREECAKVCDEVELKNAAGQYGTYVAGWSDGTDDCAAAIRSRT